MKTSDEIVEHLQEIVTRIYLRPAMYGQNVGEVEQALFIYHQLWAFVTERSDDYFRALADAGEAAGCGNMSFDWGYRKLHPDAAEHEVLEFALRHWATVTGRLGMPVPADYPDSRHSFSPNTA